MFADKKVKKKEVKEHFVLTAAFFLSIRMCDQFFSGE